MNTWYNTPARVGTLHAAAQSWKGTPFGQNGMIKGPGGGVSCQKLCAALQIESGFLEVFEVPAAPMAWARHQKESIIVPFMDAHPKFERVSIERPPIAGDVLGFEMGACIHHMGTSLGNGIFVHVFQRVGVVYGFLIDPTFAKRLKVVWRPIP